MEQMRERVARQYIPMRCDNIPVSCVDFAVVDTLTGKEVCRVWSEDDCRMLADLLNAPPISDAALAPMQPEIDRRVAEERAKLLEWLLNTPPSIYDGPTRYISLEQLLAQFEKENSDEQF